MACGAGREGKDGTEAGIRLTIPPSESKAGEKKRGSDCPT